jgi:DNA-binding HxlR family transcriptional regulator
MTNPNPNILSAGCPSRKVLELLADKWSLLVIAALTRGFIRNGEILREIGGISQKMLTQTLRVLERDGIVHRTVFAAVPPKVEYGLTDLGKTLIPIIGALGGWAEQHYPEVEQARAEYETTQI